ncbi:MAG: aquaporin family protein [Candidatus Sumerlaeaceae bacterium]|nr:aquaporin family protein [Candidatus Sumerlaeaceae bacterium]
MQPFLAEFIGTALLILLGDGVVANVVLNRTKGQNSGWIVITWGWAIGVFVGVVVAGAASGAHLNPAVSVALATVGKFEWAKVPGYIGAQMLGAMVGAGLVWVHYRLHFKASEDKDLKLAVFCTGPAIRDTPANLICEIIGTFVLVFAALMLAVPTVGLGSIDALPIALVVLGIGLSLGGTTGYAINPARDLGPRIMHAILPIPGKRDSDWGYSWIPVVGPIVGAILAALVFRAIR